jgi:hypothetical protein
MTYKNAIHLLIDYVRGITSDRSSVDLQDIVLYADWTSILSVP